MLIRFPIMIGVYQVVLSPLKYILGIEETVITAAKTALEGVTGKALSGYYELNILDAVKDHTISSPGIEEKLNNVRKEADVILEETRKKALENESVILKEARDESDLLKKKTQSDIEKFKEQVKDEIRQETIEVATAMARKIIAETLDDNRKKEILDETIKEMENLKWLA